MNDLIKIEITEFDAVQFRDFQKHYQQFMTLVKAGVFEIRNGTAMLSFDNTGTLKTITRNDYIYNVMHKEHI